MGLISAISRISATFSLLMALALEAAVPTFDGERAFNHVTALTSLGPRVAAGPAAAKGATYLKAQLASFGYVVTEHRVPMLAFEDRGTQVTLGEAKEALHSAVALLYSPSGRVQGEVVVVPGQGLASDFGQVNLKGKIALVARGGIYMREKVACAARGGAAAVLIHNTAPDPFVGTLGRPTTIPAIALSGQDGQALRAKLAAGQVVLRLISETLMEPREGINVVATKAGTSGNVLLFGGHYDGVTNSVGANDNASGVAVLLELARVLAQAGRPETLRFVGFDGEEEGLLGSTAYVESLSEAERKAIECMFNFDNLAAGSAPFVLEGTSPSVGKALMAFTARNQRTQSEPLGGGSDHAPFADAGVPVLMFYRPDPLAHTPQDEPARVQPDLLKAVGTVALELLP